MFNLSALFKLHPQYLKPYIITTIKLEPFFATDQITFVYCTMPSCLITLFPALTNIILLIVDVDAHSACFFMPVVAAAVAY